MYCPDAAKTWITGVVGAVLFFVHRLSSLFQHAINLLHPYPNSNSTEASLPVHTGGGVPPPTECNRDEKLTSWAKVNLVLSFPAGLALLSIPSSFINEQFTSFATYTNNAPITRMIFIAYAIFTVLEGVHGRLAALAVSYQDYLPRSVLCLDGPAGAKVADISHGETASLCLSCETISEDVVRKKNKKFSARTKHIEDTIKEPLVLDLPELDPKAIPGMLAPAGLCDTAGACSFMRDRCRGHHLWKLHMKEQWDRAIREAAFR
ncbi:F-box protein [Nymphaea thermarum]|nr:F-box protein [Nymphaea thermarum]